MGILNVVFVWVFIMGNIIGVCVMGFINGVFKRVFVWGLRRGLCRGMLSGSCKWGLCTGF